MADRIRLTVDLPEAGLRAGDSGRVAGRYADGRLYVEFDCEREDGPEAAIAAVEPWQVEPEQTPHD